MRSVSVIGIGETKMGRMPNTSFRELIKEAGNKAIDDSKINREKIQAVYFGNFNGQQLAGQGHMGPLVAETLKLGTIPTIRVEGACASGSLALRQAYIAVGSGLYDCVLVGGAEKMTHRSSEDVTAALASASDTELEADIGMTFPSIFALAANRYKEEYGDPREAMTACAIKNHKNATLNPDSQLKKIVTKEQIENGVKVADPFTVFDCSLVSDGSVFVVVCATEKAKELTTNKPIEIIGMGHAGDNLAIANRQSITSFIATKEAAKQAYAMAGLTPADIDLAEVHDCFTITEIIDCEDLGFFKKGEGAKAILEGKTENGGQIPVNVSGGLKAKGHPIGATGLSQIYEVVTQLRGDAGERQVKNAKVGLTHNIGGAASTCVVTILREAK